MNREQFNLDVSSPDKLAPVLRAMSEQFIADAMELDAAWQDSSAGKPWVALAKVLERAAEQADKACKRHGW